MVKTNISELIDFYFNENQIEQFLPYVKKTVLNLCLQIRESSLIEAANKADADYYIFGNSDDEKRIESYDLSNVECYVLKESILQLDKNSIEI